MIHSTLTRSRKFVVIGALLVLPHLSVAEQTTAAVDYKTRFPIVALTKGTVTEVNAQVGQQVSAGEVLIKFDSTIRESRVAVRQSVIDRLKIEVDSLSAKFDRQQELFDRGSLSLLAFEESENALQIARLRLAAAQAKLKIARYKLSRTKHSAPFDAVVLERNVHPGMNVLPELQSRPLLVLAEQGDFIVRLSLKFESWDLVRRQGAVVNIKVNETELKLDTNMAGSAFYTVESDQGIEYIAELNFEENATTLRPGMMVTVVY